MENWPKKTRMPYKSHGMFMQYSQPQVSIVTSANVKKNIKKFTLRNCSWLSQPPQNIAELGHLIFFHVSSALYYCFPENCVQHQHQKRPKKLNMLTQTSLIHPIETSDPPGGIKTYGFWHPMTSQAFLGQRKLGHIVTPKLSFLDNQALHQGKCIRLNKNQQQDGFLGRRECKSACKEWNAIGIS